MEDYKKKYEEYKKKYEDALERMKSWARGEHPECFTEAQKTAEFIFPELKESEDERIRKGIFKALSKKDARDVLISQGVEVSDALAWIEKQGEPIDKEKVLIGARKDIALSIMDFLDMNTLGMCLSNMECEDLEDAVVDSDWSKVYNYMKKKLEKQDELRSTDKEEPTDYNSIDPCFGKPIDKREPKFKVGDWCIDVGDGTIFQIVKVLDNSYTYKTNEGKEYSCSHYSLEIDARIWTIQDAKDGDVLAITMYPEGTWVGIFKELTGCTFSSYCFVNTEGIFKLGTSNHSGKAMHPATKEQRELLFQKMKESGYKWENSQLEEINDEGFVDLGLPSGTLWSKCNLGAEKETDIGLFFQWGDTRDHCTDEGHQFNWNDYKYGSWRSLTKYNTSDKKLILDNEDDPVFATTNGKFKTPTKEQLEELIDHTNYEWIEIDGVKGMKFINKNDDTKYIFIPAAGDCNYGSHCGVGYWGYVWSASRYEFSADNAWFMYFNEDDVDMNYFHRCDGFSVRGVVNPQTETFDEIDDTDDGQPVDLGLPSGTLWQKSNLGASKPSDFGKFFQWGDTQGYDGEEGHNFRWDTYKWGTSGNLAKYNNSDYKTNLDNEDDPVFAATNGKFKSPTKDQLQELIDHTNHKWIEIDDVKGMKFINKSDDTKYIFIPAAGFCGNSNHDDVGSWGCVWSAYCNEYGVDYAWNINFSADYVGMDYFHRCDGFSVRGVVNPKPEMSKEP